jgi:hypothetical protein
VTKYVFSDVSLRWLKDNRFNDDEIGMLHDVLNVIEHSKSRESRIKLPKDASAKVSALVYLLDSITDADGRPICFEESGLIDVPDEARRFFEEDLELEMLEKTTEKLKSIKFARRYSYPRRRGEHKQDRTPPV